MVTRHTKKMVRSTSTDKETHLCLWTYALPPCEPLLLDRIRTMYAVFGPSSCEAVTFMAKEVSLFWLTTPSTLPYRIGRTPHGPARPVLHYDKHQPREQCPHCR